MMLVPKLRGEVSAGKNTPLIGEHYDYPIALDALTSCPWTASAFFYGPMIFI